MSRSMDNIALSFQLHNYMLIKNGILNLDGWYVELERMNEGKRGATYGYPNSFVQLLGYVKAYFHLPYRIGVQ
jgi:hypothetical protein